MTRYIRPDNLADALTALGGPEAKVLAGGTDLMVHMRGLRQKGEPLPGVLVDVSRLNELNRLELNAPKPFLGAGISFRTLETDDRVINNWPLLAQSAATVGSVQVRHTATIGGNVANASPAADGVSALTALGARALLAGPDGERRLPLPDLIAAPGKNNLSPSEMIVGFELDAGIDPAGQCFLKVGRRRSVAVARLNVAVALDKEMKAPRFVLGACFPSPRRLTAVEDLLKNATPGEELWKAAGQRAAQAFGDECGWRSSAVYKVPAIARVSALALKKAWAGLEGAA